jgi:hypothetical protein
LIKSRQLTHFVSKKALWLLHWTSSYILCKDVYSPQITTKGPEVLFVLNIIYQTSSVDGWPMYISVCIVHLCHSSLQFSSLLLIFYLFIGILTRRFKRISFSLTSLALYKIPCCQNRIFTSTLCNSFYCHNLRSNLLIFLSIKILKLCFLVFYLKLKESTPLKRN